MPAEQNPLMTLLEFYFNPRGYQMRQEQQRQEQTRQQVNRIPQGSQPAGAPLGGGNQAPDLMTAVRRNQAETNPQVRAEVEALLGPLSRQHREAIAATERDIASAEQRQREAQALLAQAGTRPAMVPSYGASPAAMGVVIPPRRPQPAPAPQPAQAGPPPISDEITVVGDMWNAWPELQRAGGPFVRVGPQTQTAQVAPTRPVAQGRQMSALQPVPEALPVNGGPFRTMPPFNPADAFARQPAASPNAASPVGPQGYIPPTGGLPALARGGGQTPFPFAQRPTASPMARSTQVFEPAPPRPPAPEGFDSYGRPIPVANAPMGTGPIPAPPPVRSIPQSPPGQVPASARAQLPAPTPELGQNMPPEVKAQLIAELQRLSLEAAQARKTAGVGQNVGQVGLEPR